MKNHNAYIGGIPDAWYSGNRADLWIEYKYLPVKAPRITVIPDLSELQLRWIIDRDIEGRDIWVIVGCKAGGVIYKDIETVIAGLPADQFIANLQPYKELARSIDLHCSF